MATLDSVLRPSWIFETLRLWQPATSVPILMEQVMDLAAQELITPSARQRAVNLIFRLYIDATGRGGRRRTRLQNLWAAYCRGYHTETLAPAFLTHLVANVELAQEAGSYFRNHDAPGSVITAAAMREGLAMDCDGRPISPGSVAIWLRTLAHFRVLTPGERVGAYCVRRPLPVAGSIFPLLVYSWAQARRMPRVHPVAFAQDPILSYVERGGFDHYWRLHAEYLWHAETEGAGADAQLYWRLRYTKPDDFTRALINLMTTYRRPRRYARARSGPAGLHRTAAPSRRGLRPIARQAPD